jgi:hypothetical protein
VGGKRGLEEDGGRKRGGRKSDGQRGAGNIFREKKEVLMTD